MEQKNLLPSMKKNQEKIEIKDSPNKILWLIAFLILLFVVVASGYYLYSRIFNQQSTIDDGFDNNLRYIEVSAKKAKDMIDKNENLVVLDVSSEYINGHIPRATNIRINELAGSLEKLNKNDEILVYGRFNMNAVEAANILADNGFNKIYRLRGEFNAWISEGFNIETGEGPGIKIDSDNDGISDKEEEALGSNPFDPDTDKDGLMDGDELRLGTDITNPDTDGDGFLDGEEVKGGYDPLSKPDESQNKTRELEKIDLEAIDSSDLEATAGRYMSQGNYYLEVSGALPKIIDQEKYIVFLINDNTGEKVRTGELKFVKDLNMEGDGEIDYAQYSLDYQTQRDYYEFYIIELHIQQEIDTIKVMQGEFQRGG